MTQQDSAVKVNFYFNSITTLGHLHQLFDLLITDIPDGGDNILYRNRINFFSGTLTHFRLFTGFCAAAFKA